MKLFPIVFFSFPENPKPEDSEPEKIEIAVARITWFVKFIFTCGKNRVRTPKNP